LWLSVPAPAQQPASVFIEELTWTEVRDLIKAGKTTVIFPTGGTEQNGPHMAMGKHNFIIKHTAEQIARRLGNALVAPVLAYVPEGETDPPSGMVAQFPGTITLPAEYFMKVCEYAAKSFRLSGFKDIVFIGDNGANQDSMKSVADRLNKEWAGSGVRIHFVGEYYTSGGAGFREWLKTQGEKDEDIGSHATIGDTSQLLVLHPNLIRTDRLANKGGFEGSGVTGNPSKASVAYGRKALEMKIDSAVNKIKELAGK
jgi:creatinine amidohydrolase/Fe(II)-dependent formamide hydrolase-like protein